MSATFYTFEDFSDGSAAFGTNMPENQLVSEHPYFVRTAMWSLHNAAGSGKIVRLRCLEVSESAGNGNSDAHYSVNRISAIVGGEDVEALALDSNNAAIPSQVQIVKSASSVTKTTVLRRISRTPSPSVAGGDLTEVVRVNVPFGTMGSSDCQDIVLNEGEGLSIVPSNDLIFGRTLPYEFSILFTIGAESYMVQALSGTRSEPVLSILNGTGSGVVVTVRRIMTRVFGTWTGYGSEYSCERIHSHYGGDAASALAMDADSLPADVTSKRGAVCNVDGAFRGSHITKSPIRRYGPQHIGTAQGGGNQARLLKFNKLMYGQDADSDLVLRENEGAAVLMRSLTSFHYPQVHAIWTVEDAPSGGVALTARGFT